MNIDIAWMELPTFIGLFAFAFAVGFTALVIRLAHRFGWIARPRQDRWHRKPTALMGGIALFASMALATLLFNGDLPAWLLIGSTLMFLTGVIDDRLDLLPSVKMLAQIFAACLPLFAGMSFTGLPIYVAVPLTLLWMIGITNAVNLIDGMDGLAAGITMIAGGVLALLAWQFGHIPLALLGATMVGATAGFLVFNFNPARIFMGDGGSLLLGYLLAGISLGVQGEVSGREQVMVILVPCIVLAVPIFDTSLVTISRILNGRKITQGGIDHSMHRLVMLGLSERRAVAVLWGIGSILGVLSLVVSTVDHMIAFSISTFVIVGLVMIGIYLGTVDVYNRHRKGDFAVQPAPIVNRAFAALHGVLGRDWKSAFGILIDLVLIVAAYILAHDLRFEGILSQWMMESILHSVPLVIIAKISVFYAFGLYRGIWRYAGTMELVRIAVASVVATVTAFTLVYLFNEAAVFSRSVFVIDWLLSTMAVAGVRFGFRGLRQFVAAQRLNGTRVLLYGAGDPGILTLRELRQNASLDMLPVGFIDDDPLKKGLTVHGVRVQGSFQDLAKICNELSVEEVIICVPEMSMASKAAIRDVCRDLRVRCRTMEWKLSPIVVPSDHEIAPTTAAAQGAFA